MWDLIVSVPDHGLSFYSAMQEEHCGLHPVLPQQESPRLIWD